MSLQEFYNPDTDKMVRTMTRACYFATISNMAKKLKSIVDAEGESFYACTDKEKFLSIYSQDFEPNAAECLYHFIETSAAQYILDQPSGKWNQEIEETVKTYCDGKKTLLNAFVFVGKCVAYSLGMEVDFESIKSPYWPAPSTYNPKNRACKDVDAQAA